MDINIIELLFAACKVNINRVGNVETLCFVCFLPNKNHTQAYQVAKSFTNAVETFRKNIKTSKLQSNKLLNKEAKVVIQDSMIVEFS